MRLAGPGRNKRPDPPAAGRLIAALALAAAWLVAAAAPSPAPPASRWSQLTQISFQQLDHAPGLPGAIATAVAEDGQGFLWIGTLAGLARWDGYRFRVFRADPGRPGALPDNFVQTLHTDAAGRLWVGTSAGALARYDSETESFVHYPAGRHGLSHVSVRAVDDDGSGGLWVATDGGLDHLDPATGEIRSAAASGPDGAGLRGLPVYSLLRDHAGSLWAGTSAGLYRRRAGSPAFDRLPLDAVPQSLAEDSRGQVWVGTERAGAFVIDPEAGAVKAVAESPRRAGGDALELQKVSAILEIRPGEIWLATPGNGIVTVDEASGATRRIRNFPALPASLADNTVNGMQLGRSGLVWVVTNRGVSQYNPTQQAVLNMVGAPLSDRRSADGAPGTDVMAMGRTQISWILPVGDQRIWLATHKSGIDIIDPQGVRVAALRPDPARPRTALPPDSVVALARVADGSVFIATKRGLYRADADGGHLARVAVAGRAPDASTWALLADGPRLWIGGQSDGVWRLDLDTGAAQSMRALGAQALTDERVTVLATGPTGSLWIGTRNGLNRYDPATGSVWRILPEPARGDGLNAGFIASLYTDRQQRLWVGTYGGGISILPPGPARPAPRFMPLRTAQGLPDEDVNALIEDLGGSVWACTDGGLARIDPDTLSLQVLRRAEGVLFPTYWTGSAARTAQGELLFGGDGGMTVVRPQLLHPWTWRPQLVITELRGGGRVLPAGRHLGGLGDATVPVVVPAAANSLAVEFAATDLSAPERNRYAYRLEGYDPDWVEADSTHRVASYSNLPPGRYRLRLRGSNRDGLWSERDEGLQIQVMPAWHQMLWVRLAAAFAAIALLTGVVRWRTHYLRVQQAGLERKVRERTALLEQVTEALAEKSRILQASSISDPLTGLRNRRFLAEHIDAAIAAGLRRSQEAHLTREAQPLDTDHVFLLIDIDHFKRVNDEHGHAAGDAVLVQFARRLQSVMRESDDLVRWGGEEFLAVARDTDRGRAEELAERIRSIVADAPFVVDGAPPLHLRCSLGFACLPFAPNDPRALGWEDVVKLADVALFAAKRLGRNAWVGLHATATLAAEDLRSEVAAATPRAVRRGEIRVCSSHPEDSALAALAGEAPPTSAAAIVSRPSPARPR